jgi:hypothetical protein
MMGIDRDSALPPGVKIEYVYYGDDPWAGNGNENFLTFLKNFAGIPVGNHAIPNENDPNAHIVVIQDKDGNLHKIFVRDQDVFITAIENAGLHVMDSASATAAINAFFPQNYDPNSTEAPRADVRAGMAFAAKALDAQFGTGDMIQKIVAGMPEELKQLMDDGWNGINDVMDAVATAMADPTPENLMHAFQVIGDTIQKVLGDVNATLESFGFNVSSPANMNVSAASMATQLKSSTGVDFSSSFQSLVNNFNQPAPQIQSAANTWLNAQAQLKLDQTQASANASLNVQTPITDIAASVNTNVTLPSATNGFNMNAQAEATVTTPAQESLNPAASVASGFFGTSETPVAPLAPAPSAAAAEISAPAPIVVTQESLSSGSVVANQFFETNDAPASVATPATTSSDTPSVNIFRPTTPAPAPVSAPEASAEISAPAAPVWEPVPAPEPVYVAPPAPVFIPEAVAPAPAPAPVVMPEPAPAPLLPIVEFAPAPAPVPAFEMPSAPAPAPAPFVMPDLSNILTPSSAPASTPTLPAFDFNLAPAPSGSSAEITLPGLG